MKISVKNIHIGEMSSNRVDTREGDIVFTDNKNFGGLDVAIDIEVSPDELIDAHKTMTILLEKSGPVIEKVMCMFNKFRTNEKIANAASTNKTNTKDRTSVV